MGVYISGMQMPEDCFSCPLKEEGFCNITNAYATQIYKRNSDCPLVELPEHHGRLIDADALAAESHKDGAYGYVDTKQIYDAPTRVVAE